MITQYIKLILGVHFLQQVGGCGFPESRVFMRSLQTKLLQGTGPCGVRGLLPQSGTVSLINDLIFCPSAFFKNPDIIQICIKATHLHCIISVVFRLFPMFCSHHYNLIPEHLHHSEEKTAHISSPSPLAATHLFPVHINRVILDISYKMEADTMGPFASGFFHLACFQGLSVHLCCTRHQCALFLGCILFHCIECPHSAHPVTS